MLIVGDSLRGLNNHFRVVKRELVLPEEDFSLNLALDRVVKKYETLKEPIVYGQDLPPASIKAERIKDPYLLLEPGDTVLACSVEVVSMPEGYFGLVQTKGSLARLFVTATCCDGQIEPGYDGRVTFELVNLGKNSIHIPIGARVAQMYIFRCSTRATPRYSGKYQGAKGPTESWFGGEA